MRGAGRTAILEGSEKRKVRKTWDPSPVIPPSAGCRSEWTTKRGRWEVSLQVGGYYRVMVLLMNLQGERERGERANRSRSGGVSFTERHNMVSLWRKKVRESRESSIEEKKCLPLWSQTSCGRIQECLQSRRTGMWLPPAVMDDTFLGRTVAGWFSLSIITWGLLYLQHAACDWDVVSVSFSNCCLLLCVFCKHTETVAWSCPH